MTRLGLLAVLGLMLLVTSAQARSCPGDRDCDGLSNQQERTLGTDRRSADTDHDGLSDGMEVKDGSDPTKTDTDDDGVDDGDEVADGTDPEDTDSDDDGTPDGDDDDPADQLDGKLVGPLGSVDAAAKTLSMFGCLVVDTSVAEIGDDDLTLADVAPGTIVEIRLDGSKLPALVAKKIDVQDRDHDGRPDDHDDDDDGDGILDAED